MSLKIKAINGILWVSINKILLKLINFVITIVLARLLSPSDFGLVALALIFVNFFEISRDLGMESALIQIDENEDEKNVAYNTAFILYPTFAIFLYICSYLISPYASSFFENDSVEPIIKVLLLTIIIWSFGTLPRTLLIKNLEFKQMMLPQIVPRIFYGIVAIFMAYLGYGVWSLVVGRILFEISSVFVYWKALKWRPSIQFSKRKALQLFSFGKFVMISSIIVFLLSSLDVTIIGKVLEIEQLGYYTISLSIAGLFTIQIATMISQVIFPTYSKLQHNITKMRNAHLSTVHVFSLLVLPATYGIISTSWYFIKVIYGDKWLPAASILQILCVYGLFTSFTKINSTIFLAAGKPKSMTIINLIQLLTMAILIYPLTSNYGILGSSIAITFPAILASIYSFTESNKLLKQSMADIMKNILPAIKGTMVMIIVLSLFQNVFPSNNPQFVLIGKVTIGFLTYLAYILVVYKAKFDITSLREGV